MEEAKVKYISEGFKTVLEDYRDDEGIDVDECIARLLNVLSDADDPDNY